VKDYRNALAALEATPAPASLGEPAERAPAAAPAATPELFKRAEVVEQLSSQLGQVFAEERRSPDAERSELAAVQLLASAAADLKVAHELYLATEARGEEPERTGAGVPEELLELMAVSPAAGLAGLRAVERAARGPSPNLQAAQVGLRSAVDEALTDIQKAAAAAVQVNVAGITKLSLPAVSAAANLVLHDALVKLGDALSSLLRKAFDLIRLAIDKILAALGKDVQDELRKKAGEWVEELRKGGPIESFLGALYEVNKIKDETERRIDAAASITIAAFDVAREKVAGLSDRFEAQKKAIQWVARGLSWVGPWVMTLTPYGPLCLVGAYVAISGYAIYAGGDYVDWYGTGQGNVFDLVTGVRGVVARELV
jgi:hypothetical protein